MKHIYTDEHSKFIADNVKGRTVKELTKLFNDHFNLNLSVNQLRAFKKNHSLTSDLDFKDFWFKKGRVPYNKGKPIGGWKPTQFKKGRKPHNYKPVGTERVNGDGYVDIKIADPNKWRGKHLLVWEEHNGPIPKSHCVIFGDGDRRNFDPHNLILVSRKQLAMLNKHNLIQSDADLTRTGVIIADIYQAIGERKKAK